MVSLNQTLGWVDTHHGVDMTQNTSVETAEEVDPDDESDDECLDMEDFDLEVDDLVIGKVL
jgi:hypothetical protein